MTIKQEDRDAAAKIEKHTFALYGEDVVGQVTDLTIKGGRDNSVYVQAFARHRESAFIAGAKAMQDAALPEVITDRTRYQHGKHCSCTTCELNEAEDAIRSIDPEALESSHGPA